MTRSATHLLFAAAATLLSAACVNLTPPWAGQNDASRGGAPPGVTGGSGGSVLDAASGGSGGGTATGGTTADGAGGLLATGGTTAATGGAAGSITVDAGSPADVTVSADGAIDVAHSADVSPSSDRATGGSGGLGGSGDTDAGAAGAGGAAGQTGDAGGGQSGTGGAGGLGGSGGTDAGAAGAGATAGQSGSGGSGSGGTTSSGGIGDAGATGGSGGGTTATGGAVTTCTPVPKSTGGISCPGGFCTVGAYSGYDFPLVDTSTKSSICMSPNGLCAAGIVGVQDPPNFKVWGAGFGFSLSPLTTATMIVPVQLTGSGVSVTLSSLPTGGASARVLVTVGAAQYCAVMTKATQTIPWTSFNLTCWAPTPAGALTGAPNASNIQFEASAGTTAGSFDLCMTGLSFQ